MSDVEKVEEAVKIYDGLVLDTLDFLAERLGWDGTAVLVHALLIRDVVVEAVGLENTDSASDQLRDTRDRIIARMTKSFERVGTGDVIDHEVAVKAVGALEAIKSVSLLGEHEGVMDDDLFDLLAELKGDK